MGINAIGLVWTSRKHPDHKMEAKYSFYFQFTIRLDPNDGALTWFSLKSLHSQRRLISKALDGAGVGGLGELKATTAKEFNG